MIQSCPVPMLRAKCGLSRVLHAGLGRLQVLALFVFVAASVSNAEILEGHLLSKRTMSEEELNPVFKPSDFLRLCLEPVKRNRFILGEPVPLKFRLANHTESTVLLNIHFDHREGLNIEIQDRSGRKRRYNGPNDPGAYPPLEIKMYPFEERPFSVLLWGERGGRNEMAFPDPGQYAIHLRIKVDVPSTGISSEMVPLDPLTLAPAPPFMIEVLPPPPEMAPLVQELVKSKAFTDLQVRRLPGNDLAKYEKLVKDYPATPITPYLTFMLGLHYNYLSLTDPEDESKKQEAGKYYQMTALADSEIRSEAWEAQLRLYDQWGLSEPARDAALMMIKTSPPQIAPMIGQMELVKKYLPNSAEMSPDIYWDLLN